MFEKQYFGEEVIFAQNEDTVKSTLVGYYTDVDLAIKEMKDSPEKWVVQTGYAKFRWSETGEYAPVQVRMNGPHGR